MSNLNSRSGYSSPTKIICLVLAVLTVLTMFLPWMSISLDTKYGKMDVNGILEDVLGSSLEDAIDSVKNLDVEDLIRSFSDITAAQLRDFRSAKKSALALLRGISDGKLSPVETMSALFSTAKVMRVMARYDSGSEDAYRTAAAAATAVALVFLVLILTAVLFLVLTVLNILRDKRKGGVAPLVLYSVLSALYFLIIIGLNAAIASEIANSYTLRLLGIDRLRVFHFTVYPPLGIGMLAALLVLRVSGKPKTIPCTANAARQNTGSWECACGNVNSETESCCTLCGANRS